MRDNVSTSHAPPTSQQPSLTETLDATDYRSLFQLSGGATALALWSSLGAPRRAELVRLLSDANADRRTVFLGAELAATFEPALWRAADPAVLATAYGAALSEDYVGMANPWGLPGKIGPLGLRLLDLGEAAVPVLMASLDTDTPVVYAGSEEAAIGNGYRYRVKDLAAYYLGLIRSLVFQVERSPTARDQEIQRLRRLL